MTQTRPTVAQETQAVVAEDRAASRATLALALAGPLAAGLPFWLLARDAASPAWIFAAVAVAAGVLLPVLAFGRGGLAALAAGGAAGLPFGFWLHGLAATDLWLAYVLGFALLCVGGGTLATALSIATEERRGLQAGCALGSAWFITWGVPAVAMAFGWQA